jgi:hypothetical protein
VSHQHFIEFFALCGHLARQCKCDVRPKPIRRWGGLCADCAIALSREKTAHHFPRSIEKGEVRPPRLHIDDYVRWGGPFQQAELFDGAQEVESRR